MSLRRWAGDFLKKSVEWFNTELLDTVQKASLSFTHLSVLNCDRNQVVFFLLGALTIVEIMDAHKGAAVTRDACEACRGRASNGHEADGSCLVIKGIRCERGHHCGEHVQKALK